MSAEPRHLDVGSGPPLVLLHGTLFDHRMFEPQAEGLADELRVVAYDSRARDARGEDPYGLYELVEDLRAELDRRELDRALVGGMSVGAFAALRFALDHPDRAAGLVLIGCQATALSPEDRRLWGDRYATRRGGPVGPEFAAEEAAVNFGAEARRDRPDLIEAWRRRFAEDSGDRLYLEARSWLEMDDVSDRLGELGMPTLVIHGSEDEGVPLAEGELIHERVAGSRMLTLPATGHAANLERPDEVNAAIRRLAAECDPPLAQGGRAAPRPPTGR